MKKQLFIVVVTLIFIFINNLVYAEVLKGENAYNIFRIKDYKNIKYNIDELTTNKYNNHTNAWENAVNSFSKETFGEIGFIKSKENNSKIIMTSVNSSKEEWLGLSRSTISTNTNGTPILQKSQNYLNHYTIKSFGLSNSQINEVALHELGHSFGLKHQPQEYEYKSIMVPYVNVMKESNGVLKKIDKYNLLYYYSSKNDWENHWSADSIKEAINKGWTDETNYFRPNESITRAEFVEMINKKFDLKTYSGKVFADTVDHWAKDEIDIAFTNGVCIGKSEYSFEPDSYITRQEAAKMIANYMNLGDKNHDKVNLFVDYIDIDGWARDEFEAVIKYGYIIGTPEKMLLPKGNISRSETITILSRI